MGKMRLERKIKATVRLRTGGGVGGGYEEINKGLNERLLIKI